MSLPQRLLRNTSLHFCNMLLRAFFATLLSLLAARTLGAASFGGYQFLVWVVGMGVLAVNWGVPTTVTRYVAEFDGRGDRASAAALLRRALLVRLALGLLAAVALTLLPSLLGAGGLPRLWLALAGLVVLCEAMFGIVDAAISGLQRYRYTTLLVLVRGTSELALTWIALRVLGWGVAGLLLVNVAELLLLLLLATLLLRRDFAGHHGGALDGASGRRVLRFASGMALITLLNAVVWDKSEIFFLHRFCPPAEVGYYGLAFGWSARLFGLLPGVLTGVLMPLVAGLYGADDAAGLRRLYALVLRALGLLAFPLGALGALGAEPLMALYGPEFAGVVPPLRVLFLSGTVVQLAYAGSSLALGLERQRFILWANVAVGAANVALDLLLIPGGGALGAAWANALSQAGASLLSGLYIALRLRFPTPVLALARTALAAALAALPACALLWLRAPVALPLGLALYAPAYGAALLALGALSRSEALLLAGLAARLPSPLGPRCAPLGRALARLIPG